MFIHIPSKPCCALRIPTMLLSSLATSLLDLSLVFHIQGKVSTNETCGYFGTLSDSPLTDCSLVRHLITLNSCCYLPELKSSFGTASNRFNREDIHAPAYARLVAHPPFSPYVLFPAYGGR